MKAKFGIGDGLEMRKKPDLIPSPNFPEPEPFQDDTPQLKKNDGRSKGQRRKGYE